jgi:hypothetical protein
MGDKANPRRARDIPSFYRGDGGMVINHDIVQPKAALTRRQVRGPSRCPGVVGSVVARGRFGC